MRKVHVSTKGLMCRNETYVAKSIEQELAEVMAGESVELGGKSLLYTERKDGVLWETNIRTDRWEIAQDALDVRERSKIARKEAAVKDAEAAAKAKESSNAEGSGGVNPSVN